MRLGLYPLQEVIIEGGQFQEEMLGITENGRGAADAAAWVDEFSGA